MTVGSSVNAAMLVTPHLETACVATNPDNHPIQGLGCVLAAWRAATDLVPLWEAIGKSASPQRRTRLATGGCLRSCRRTLLGAAMRRLLRCRAGSHRLG